MSPALQPFTISIGYFPLFLYPKLSLVTYPISMSAAVAPECPKKVINILPAFTCSAILINSVAPFVFLLMVTTSPPSNSLSAIDLNPSTYRRNKFCWKRSLPPLRCTNSFLHNASCGVLSISFTLSRYASKAAGVSAEILPTGNPAS